MSVNAPPSAVVKKRIVKIIRKVVPKRETPLPEATPAEDAVPPSAAPPVATAAPNTAPMASEPAAPETTPNAATNSAVKTTTTRFRKVVRKKIVVRRILKVSAAAAGEDKEKAVSKLAEVEKDEGTSSSSPLRRSERIEESRASCSSGSEKSEKSSSILDKKNKEKETYGGKLTKEPSKDDKLEVQGGELLKRKMRLDARSYRASFKPVAKKTNNSVPDDEGDRTEVYTSPREEAGGRSLADVDVKSGGEVRACKRAKTNMDLDSDGSATLLDNVVQMASTPDATSSSPNISIEECNVFISEYIHSGRPDVMHSIDIAEEHINSTHMKEPLVLIQAESGHIQAEGDHNVCVVCKRPGFFLWCDGKNCKRSYHLSCLDPPLKDFPPGVWHCISCVKKKIKSGVYSVAEGIEYIWDSKEGMQNEKLYLVKYKGLAHVHNRWVPESLMLLEAPTLLDKFKRKHEKEKVRRWKKEWSEPHRLLLKRVLIPQMRTEEHFSGNRNDFPNCYHEWLVKWKGLDYEHATWELESSPFLCSSEGMVLINNYERQREEARKASDPSRVDKALSIKSNPFCELLSLPVGCTPGLHNGYLNAINRLREFWHRAQSAVFIDDQERMVKSILFISSLLSHACQPFLIITSITSLSSWESEFIRVAPSINFVVYNGDKNLRKIIQTFEFYEEGGCVMFQVLLSHPDAIVEDIEALDCMGWEAVIVDECQNLRVSAHFEQFRSLSSDFRLLLLSGQLKDDFVEYLNLLSFLDPRGQEAHVNSLNFDCDDSNDVLAVLKKRLARYTVYDRKVNSSKFLEYWVPVHLSTVQIEQYCDILLSNSLSLCSQSKRDHVGALHDILLSVRKCCDHPYLVDGALRNSLTKSLPRVQRLDFEVNASGKLQLLDQILHEMKNNRLRVLIIFQSIDVARRISIGDILDDFLRERFGADSYERVEKGMISLKKQDSLNMFNDKASGRFVFLIETRACLPSIKLSSVDAVIIFSSDWNPVNDLKALQKISFDSQAENVRVFRFYSSCTVEEKVLIYAKKNMILESNIKNISLSVYHSLLGWGASYIFSKLDEFHQHDCHSETSTDQLLLNALFELFTQTTDARYQSVLVKAQQSEASYVANILVGEKENFAVLDNDPCTFWSKLLEKDSPQWRYISGSSQNTRRKVGTVYEFAKDIDVESDGFRKKRIKVASATADPISPQNWIQDRREKGAVGRAVTVSDDTASSCSNCKESLILATHTPIDSNIITKKPGVVANDASHDLHVTFPSLSQSTSEVCKVLMSESEEGDNMCNVQKELYSSLKHDLLRLCRILKFPKDVKDMAERLLAYNMKNHRVSLEPETILQAFIVSLSWRAASCLKRRVDHKESLAVAKKYLNFKCSWPEVQSVHAKLRILDNKFSPEAGTSANFFKPNSLGNRSSVPKKASSKHQELEEGEYQSSMLTEDVTKDLVHERCLETASFDHQELEEGEIRETPDTHRCSESESPILVEQEVPPDLETSVIKIQQIDLIDKICSKRLEDLLSNQKLEVDEFKVQEDQERMDLKKTRDLDLKLIRTRPIDLAIRNAEIKLLGQEFARKIFEFDQHMKRQRRKLAVIHINTRNKEKQIKDMWLEDAKAGRLPESFDTLPLSDSGFRMEKFKFSGQSRVHDGSVNTINMSEPSSDGQIIDMIATARPGGSIENVGISAESPATVPSSWAADMSVETETPAYESSTMDAVGSAKLCSPAEIPEAVPLTEILPSQMKIIDSVGNELEGMNIGSWTEATAGNEQHGATGSNGACLTSPLQSQTKLTSRALGSGSSELCRPAEIPEAVPQTEILASQMKIIDSVGNELEGMNIGSLTAATSGNEQHGAADSNGDCLTSPLQSQTKLTSGALGSGSSELCRPAEIPEAVSQTEILASQMKIIDSVGNELEGTNIGSWTVVTTGNEQHGAADSNGACLTSPLQSQTNLIFGALGSGSSGENSASFNQVVSVSEQEASAVSDGLGSNRGFSSPQPPMVSLQPVDGGPSHVEPIISSPTLPQVPPSVGLGSDVHRHANTPEPVRTEQELINQVYCSTHQTDVSQFVTQPMPSLVNIPSERTRLESLRSTDVIRETGYQFPHTFTMMQEMPTQGLHTDPLRNELMRLRKQKDYFMQMHENKKLQLKSDCEKEVEKIRRKFDMLIQDAETEFVQEKKILEMIYSKISMNISLAEEFRATFIQRKEGNTAPFQGSCSSSVPQYLQAPQPQFRQFTVSAASSSTPARAATSLTPAPTSLPLLPCQVRTWAPASATAPVPLVRNLVTPNSSTALSPRSSLQAGSGPRAPAPHLRPFRPRPAPNLVNQPW